MPTISVKFTFLIAIIIKQCLSQTVNSLTSCIANCQQCPSSPLLCPNIQSQQYPDRNFNCLKYHSGENCNKFSDGYKPIDLTLSRWNILNTTSTTSVNCMTRNQIVNSLGKFPANQTIQKKVPISLNSPQVLLLKMGFFFRTRTQKIPVSQQTQQESQTSAATNVQTSNNNPDPNDIDIFNPAPEQTITTTQQLNQTLRTMTIRENGLIYYLVGLNVSVTAPGLQELIQLKYNHRTILQGTDVPTDCGGYFQFITEVNIPQEANAQQITFLITSNGTQNTGWSLGKFQVYTGCSAFMIYSPEKGCFGCQSGYYPIMNKDNTVSKCVICPNTCLTCLNENSCISCVTGASLNQVTRKCEFGQFYSSLTNFAVVQGNELFFNATEPLSQSFSKLITTRTNKLSFSTNLINQQTFSLKFYLFYLKSIVQTASNEQFVVYVNNVETKRINISQLSLVSGVYSEKIFAQNKNQKIYVEQVNLQNLKAGSSSVTVSVNSTNAQFGKYAAGNFIGIQQRCGKNCLMCSPDTGVCMNCTSFFLSAYNCQICPNGMYFQKEWKQQNGTYIDLLKDRCVKCHSICQLCSGSSLSECTKCFSQFELQRVQYNNECIRCIYESYNQLSYNSTKCFKCEQTYSYRAIQSIDLCSACLRSDNFESAKAGQSCRTCWLNTNLAYGRCVPTAESGNRFYGTDISGGIIQTGNWKALPERLKTIEKNITTDYISIWGVQNLPPQNQQTVTLVWNEKSLPQHEGLAILFNIFVTQLNANASKNISVVVAGENQVIEGSKNIGFDIDGNAAGNQMIYSYYYRSSTHRDRNLGMNISVPNGGIFVRQVEVYLGNCDACVTEQLRYQIDYIPRYQYNASKVPGLDVWIDFGKKVETAAGTNLQNAFKFSLASSDRQLKPAQFLNQIQSNNRLKYFLPIETTFLNETLTVTTNENQRIFSKKESLQGQLRKGIRLLLIGRLNLPQSQTFVDRYSALKNDDKITVQQLYDFFNFFQWFTLIVMIVCAFFGIGVIFQDFSIMLQMLFLHVYISSYLLPATFKAPMWGLQRMENLNFFAVPHAQNIENSWFGQGFVYPSPYIFQQYNVDIYFARSYYPIIIINLIYLGWFIILSVARIFIKGFKNSKSIVAIFFRNIPQRPINYFDQIWRYQFLTTCWASFMQFHNLNGRNPRQRTVIALCFIAFIISVIWPIFVIIYTYKRTLVSYSTNFMYYYQDIYFKKNQTFGETNWKYYLYIAIRSGRILLVALFIALFTEHELVGPIVLIFIHIIEILYVVQLRIFVKDFFAMFLKVLQNVLFIFVEITLLIIYGFSDTMAQQQFLNLGYALIVLYVIMIILAFIRFVYYAYSKFKNYRLDSYGLDGGEKKQYKMTPLPISDRN